MNILGISAGFHDAAATVIDSTGNILFAGHSERYSKIKNDADLCNNLMSDVMDCGTIDHVAYYERPWAKQLRRLYSGQGVEWNKLTTKRILQQQFGPCVLPKKISNHNHHLCHAAAGFQTSPFAHRATVVVIDAIGEWDTISIWGAEYVNGQAKYKRLWGQTYPHSIGLFYSAITQRVGLHPLDEEYITMGMAAWGKTTNLTSIIDAVIQDEHEVKFKYNMHTGIDDEFMSGTTNEDIAATAQSLAERLIYNVMIRARNFKWSNNLVYMGGVALNCLANRNLGNYFENIWIMPCPGDAGSSLGAAALAYGQRIKWNNAFLGRNIAGDYPTDKLLDHLLSEQIVGVASGRAEFGPRALGNRSLLADPRGKEIKDKVNEIKRRQKFRPFAPVILEEHVRNYFDIPDGFCDSRYMQVIGRCLHPDLFPAITHVDGTSRIQTVPKDGSGIRQLLEAWYAKTGCPMLLNTSLNVRGKPMVNDRNDADEFQQLYNIPVIS
jgi:carbamoyltransferase